ncbi:MAG: cyclic nucleotide-binding domain-containing protein, partial [Acidimicrobiales bacterium]
GQQQRVAIARALTQDPPLVIADEPTAHLDYIQVEGVLSLLRELAGPHRVVLIATHDERLLPVADRVVDLSPPAAAVAVTSPLVKVEPGAEVFAQGDPGDVVYQVENGEIEIVRRRADGGEEPVTTLGPGSYFGELAPLFALRRSATARATTASVVRRMTVQEFRRAGPGQHRALEA